jgi:flavin reductase (DIM6/NTAB) family NADH-FMN oxidoreductase RutF
MVLAAAKGMILLERTDQLVAISPSAYREAMSHFAGAVHVATTDGPAGRRGVTVCAVTSVSDDPPTVIVCLNRNRKENQWFERNGCFAINTLLAGQSAIAKAFAGEARLEMNERFAYGQWERLQTGAPVLDGARMAIDCVVCDVQPIHTHLAIFGRVVACGQMRRGPALIYLDRGYRSL